MNVEPLAPLDATFLSLETPTMPLHMVAVAIVAPGPEGLGVDQVRQLVADRIHRMPKLGRRVMKMPFGIEHPVWVDQPDLDLSRHVRRACLAPPGAMAELSEFVGEFAGIPLQPDLPLWELVVVEGLHGGQVALVVKVHHSVFDGVSGIAALAGLFDPRPPGAAVVGQCSLPNVVPPERSDLPAPTEAAEWPEPPEPPKPVEPTESPEPSESEADGPGRGDVPSPADLLTVALRRWSQRPLAMFDVVATTYLTVRRLATASKADADLAGHSADPMPFRVPRAPWNGTISGRRICAVVEVPLDDLRAVGRAVGATVNDVVLAGVGGALRTLLVERGVQCSTGPDDASLVAVVPISMHQRGQPNSVRVAAIGEDHTVGGDAAGVDPAGNRVSAMILSLATDVDDAIDRLRIVAERSRQAKRRSATVGEQLVAGWAEMAVPALATRVARLASNLRVFDHLPPVGNVVVSNVVGPESALWCGGGQVQSLYPFGPVADGVGLNISVVSYRSVLSVGLVGCRDLIPDIAELARYLTESLAELEKRASDLWMRRPGAASRR